MSLSTKISMFKKYINITLSIIILFSLTSCFESKDQIDDAKKELGIIETQEKNNDSGTNIDSEIEKAKQEIKNEDTMNEEEITKKEEAKDIEITPLTDEQFIELYDLSGENLLDGKVEIKGKTLTNVDKIIVTFENATSTFPKDVYTLKQFNSGDETFLYRAFSVYETLDFGKNMYTFQAYSGDKVSKLQLVLNVVKEEEKNVSDKVEKVFEDISLSTLPVGATFGNPIDLGNGKISYSDLKGLEMWKETVSDLTCENLTSILTDRVDGWFFWNTCRPIGVDDGFSFFVIRLDGEDYVYEKHYYLSYLGIYGVQELETGTGVDNTNIGEKNDELKNKNEDYSILEVTDDLFKQILGK